QRGDEDAQRASSAGRGGVRHGSPFQVGRGQRTPSMIAMMMRVAAKPARELTSRKRRQPRVADADAASGAERDGQAGAMHGAARAPDGRRGNGGSGRR